MIDTILGTLIWLVNVPTSNGLVFVFLAVFGGLGVLMMYLATGRVRARRLPGSVITNAALVDGALPLLTAARAREHLPRATPAASRRPNLPRMLTRALLLVLTAAGILGLLGIVGVPVTHAYIWSHGTETGASIDGDWVTFTAADGRTYTVRNSDPTIGTSETSVRVRYLPKHPQAYVIVVPAAADAQSRR